MFPLLFHFKYFTNPFTGTQKYYGLFKNIWMIRSKHKDKSMLIYLKSYCFRVYIWALFLSRYWTSTKQIYCNICQVRTQNLKLRNSIISLSLPVSDEISNQLLCRPRALQSILMWLLTCRIQEVYVSKTTRMKSSSSSTLFLMPCIVTQGRTHNVTTMISRSNSYLRRSNIIYRLPLIFVSRLSSFYGIRW